ncbi:MAG TPA: tetratricopeptide repeat protein [Candidatus Binatia bacterium]|nr:tetratricopeptide repeat protein [Candidatus Binatia bacterium]
MPSCLHLVAALVAGLILAGCASTSKQKGLLAKNTKEAAADAEDRSPAAVERRVEAHARYATGVVLDLNDESEEAVDEYFKAAMADVRDEQLALEVTRRLLQLRQQEKALDLLKKATENPNASGQLYARLGMVYAINGKKEEAIEANRTAIRKSPRSLSGYENLVNTYLQGRQPEEATKVVDQAAKLPNTEPIFLIQVAELYAAIMRVGGGDTAKAKALEMYTRADKANTPNAFVLQRLADGLAALGESDRAAELYLKVLEKYPNLPTIREKLTQLYIRKEDKRKAVEQLEVIVRNNPTSAQAYYMLGNIAFEQKDFKKAVDHLSKALLLSPNFEQLYYDLAGAQINLNQPRDALQTLDKARAKFQGNFVNEYFTAMAYSRMKDHTNALKHLVAAEVIARATETNRLNHEFCFQLGAAYEQTKNYEEAEKYFRRCLELSPKFHVAMNYLGYMWADRGVNLQEARELVQKAVDLEPKNSAYLDSLGWVLFKLDRPEEALGWLQKAIENSDEPDATLYDHLGDVYGSLSKLPEARDAWRKALSLEPNSRIEKKLGGTDTSEKK